MPELKSNPSAKAGVDSAGVRDLNNTGITNNGHIPFFLVAGASIIAVVASVVSLHYGFTEIFNHIFYFPVILASFFYIKRGLAISAVLISIYYIFMILFQTGDRSGTVLFIHGMNFFLIASLISYLSYRWKTLSDNTTSAITEVMQNEERLRILLDECSDSVFSFSKDGSLMYMNRAFLTITGKTEEFFADKSIWNMFPDEKPEKRTAAVNDILQTGIEKVIEMRVPVDGVEKYYLTTLTPVRDADGDVDYIICIGKDITERRRIETDLNMTLDNLRRSQEMGRIGDWRLDLSTMNFSGSAVAFDILGLSHDSKVTYGDITSLIDPDDIFKAREVMKDAVEKGSSFSIVIRFHRKNDGALIYILSSAEVEMDDTGRPITLFGINQDITDRVKAEEALRESEKLSRIISGLTTDYAFIVDVSPDKNISLRSMSPNAMDLIKRSSSDLENFNRWNTFFPAEEYKQFMDFTQHIISSGEPGSIECRSMRENDKIRWINIIAYPEKKQDGGLEIFGAVKDITDLKNAENELFRFKFMVENARQEVYLVDPDGKLAYVNRAAAESLGYTIEEMLSIGIAGFDAELGPHFREHFKDLKDHDLDLIETVHIAKDGRRVKKEMHSVYISFNDVEYICGFGQDITERKQAEEERLKLQEQLAQSQKMESVGRLAGGIAHDFNNMLGVIIGQTELALMRSEKPDEVYSSLKEIEKAARRSADLTSQMLAFARKQAVTPRVIDLNDTITGMISMLRRLIGENIDLEWVPGSSVWNIKVDPTQIDQVLANLCVNSRDAISGNGRVTIQTDNVIIDERWFGGKVGVLPGEYVKLTVKDTGTGFAPEILEHVFEPFFTTKEIGKGTGLGLAMVYGIIKQNNGFIDVQSKEGEGACFMVYFPRSERDNSDSLNGGDIASNEKGDETILLVEDEPMLLDMTRSMLEALGYSVIATSTPAEAIKFALQEKKRIKLLITDVIMPGLNGRDLSSKILEIIPDLNRLFMSGYTADVIAHHGVLEEGVHFIQKPFSLNGLAEQVRFAIGYTYKKSM